VNEDDFRRQLTEAAEYYRFYGRSRPVATARGCGGCSERRESLNAAVPGLGDAVETVAKPLAALADKLLGTDFLGKRQVRTWAVGVRTSPVMREGNAVGHRVEALDACLRSLAAAGWRDVHVFAEPHSTIPNSAATVHRNTERLGAWRNFYETATWLYNHIQADCYLLIEDDCTLAASSRQWLAANLWPSDDAVMVSLCMLAGKRVGGRFVSSESLCEPQTVGGFLRLRKYQQLWGSQALAFPRRAMPLLLGDPLVHQQTYRGKPTESMTDVRLGSWAHRHGSSWVCSPSLGLHHTEYPSAIGHGTVGVEMQVKNYAG